MPTKKPLTDDQAATQIQRAYRRYRNDKRDPSTFVEKQELLPTMLEEPQPDAELPDNIDNYGMLFFNVKKNTPVKFTKRGIKSLFKLRNGVYTINYPLLEHYIHHGTDIRPFTLEAYLRRMISQDTFVSLFHLQQGISEFLSAPKTATQARLYSIINYDKNMLPSVLTPEVQKILLPYLMLTAPTAVQSFASGEEAAQEFQHRLTTNLCQLPQDANYFTVINLHQEQIAKIAYYILLYILQDFEPQTFAKFHRNAIGILSYAAKKLNVSIDMQRPTESDLTTLKLKLRNFLLRLLEKKNIELRSNEFDQYMVQHMDFYSYLALSVDTLVPHVYQDGTQDKVAIVIINCQTQSACMQAVTNIKAETLVQKAPMLGLIPVTIINQSTAMGMRPIGLVYEGIPVPDQVHNKPNAPYAYTLHDLRFHYEGLFYLRAFADAAYQLQLKFVEVIRQVTHQDKNFVINSILDFTSGYYNDVYTHGVDVKEQIKGYAQISADKMPERFALFEYAFIVVCDILKNPQPYADLITKYPRLKTKNETVPTSKNEDVDFLMQRIVRYFGFDFDKRIAPYREEIAKYPHSLGAFMCMLLITHGAKPFAEINDLCRKLNELEHERKITFKWNRKDGLMLNIKDLSFRFRHPNQEKDYRHTRAYPEMEYTRVFSDEKNWWTNLTTAINAIALQENTQVITKNKK